MILRHVLDLQPGDGVRPFDGGSLWTVVRLHVPAVGRLEVTLGKPTGDECQIEVCCNDLIAVSV